MVRNGPLWRLAARRWRRRPLQYLLCILGIALGVAMLVSIDLASGSAQRAFSLSTDAITGRTTHRLVAIGPGGVPDTTFVELRRQFPEIPAAPVIEAYGRAEELDGELVRVVGVDLFSEAPSAACWAATAMVMWAAARQREGGSCPSSLNPARP